MIRPPGGIVGAPPQWTPTATSGVFTLREAQEMLLDDTWARGPNAPTGLQGVSGNANIALTWSAPPGVVQNYLVYYSANGASDIVVSTNSASTSYTLAGLVNNVEYSVRVAAVSFTDGLLSAPFVIRVGVVEPVYFANGFLSALRSDTVTVSEFPNAALANGYLSVLRVGDTIPDSEFPNAALANGYLSVLYIDYIPMPSATLLRGPQASGLPQWGFQHLTGSGTAADPFVVNGGTHDTINFNPMFFVSGTATMHVEVPVRVYYYDDAPYQTLVSLRAGPTVASISSARNAGTLILNRAGVGTHTVSVTNQFVRYARVDTDEYPGEWPQLRIWFTGTTVDTSPLPEGTLLSGAGWTGEGRDSNRLTLSQNVGSPWNIPVTAAATGICVVGLLSGDSWNDGAYAKITVNGQIVGGGHGANGFRFPVVAGQQIGFYGDTNGVEILQGTILYLI